MQLSITHPWHIALCLLLMLILIQPEAVAGAATPDFYPPTSGELLLRPLPPPTPLDSGTDSPPIASEGDSEPVTIPDRPRTSKRGIRDGATRVTQATPSAASEADLATLPLARPATLLATHFRTQVSGLIATTRLEQHFLNDSRSWQEAIYRFPLPEDAAVHGMRIESNGQVISGKIAERQAAEAIYQQARDDGIAAALTSQQRPNLFEQRLANIAPGATVTVQLDFQHSVRYDDQRFSLHLPTTVTPRYVPPGTSRSDSLAAETLAPVVPAAALPAGSHETRIEIAIHSGLPIAAVDSQTHELQSHLDGDLLRVSLAEGGSAPMDRDFDLSWTTAHGDAPLVLTAAETVSGDTFVQILVEAPPQPDHGTVLAREQIWVIDTSGSMEGVSLEQAKAALLAGLESLAPGDRFNIIEFNDTPTPLFASPVEASGDWIRVARRRVGRLSAGGGTEIASALESAIDNRSEHDMLRQIVFLTDGSVGNETEVFSRISARLADNRLFTVGIGPAPNRFFLRKAAEFGRGNSRFIQNLADVAKTIGDLTRELRQPVLKNLRITLQGGQVATVLEPLPSPFPDLYAGGPVQALLRLPKAAASGVLVLTADTGSAGTSDGLHPSTWERRVELARVTPQAGIARAWARERITALEDQKVLGRDAAEVRQDVLALALAHSLVSPYTSFVAVAEEPSRPPAEALVSRGIPGLLPQGLAPAMASFPATGTAATRCLGLGVIALLTAWWWSVVEKLLASGRRGRGRRGIGTA